MGKLFRLLELPLSRIKSLEINPKERSEEKNTRELLSKMEKGAKYVKGNRRIIVPPIVIEGSGKNFILLDGHRRVSLLRASNSVTSIECLLIEKSELKDNVDINDIFALLNHQQKFSVQHRVILARDANVFITDEEERKYKDLLSWGGLPLINLLLETGRAITSTRDVSHRVGLFCTKVTKDDLNQIATYQLEFKQQKHLVLAMQAKLVPSVIWRHIQNNRPISDLFLDDAKLYNKKK